VKILQFIPTGPTCTLDDCPPGVFVVLETLWYGYKTAPKNSRSTSYEVYDAEGNQLPRQHAFVQPVTVKWEETNPFVKYQDVIEKLRGPEPPGDPYRMPPREPYRKYQRRRKLTPASDED
jgi:hypothetical protein